MKKEEVQKQERKTISIAIRTYPSYSKWMKKNNVSPTLVFNKTIEGMKNGK